MDVEKLSLLAQKFPNASSAFTEIINLKSILSLPKGTEHYLSDVHGEYEAFIHVLRNCSGVIRAKIQETFLDLTKEEQQDLATLVYYPEEKLPLILNRAVDSKIAMRQAISRVVELCRVVSRKYTRSHIRKAIPHDSQYVLEELLHEHAFASTETATNYDRSQYNTAIVDMLISTGQAPRFICSTAHVIQRLAVERLHVIGDIFDRGPGAEIIMDSLLRYHSVDVQWGNHDIVWMAAAAGSEVAIANNIRIALRYSNMKTLEEGYAISMLPLISFAQTVYHDDPCTAFQPKPSEEVFTPKEKELIGKMHKAMAVIQTKLEAEVILRHPEWEMGNRLVLNFIDWEKNTITLDGKEYELNDKSWPTIDKQNPNKLTPEEANVVARLRASHLRSERLQRHAKFLFSNGSAYLINNGMLLFHGCIPLIADGSLKETTFLGEPLKGRPLMDKIDRVCRQGFALRDGLQKQNGVDLMWYLWVGPTSPLFVKDKMATFERYFVDDKNTWKENSNPYYKLRETPETCGKILEEFGLDPVNGVILNGHTPVKVAKGETPIKAGGRCIVIDGGFSKAYQKETGIAGYTLISNSLGLVLASHLAFASTTKAIYNNADIHSEHQFLASNTGRKLIADTDLGQKLKRQIENLTALCSAYESGEMNEKVTEQVHALLPSEWMPPPEFDLLPLGIMLSSPRGRSTFSWPATAQN